jgi:hypothetical protein
MVDILIFEKIYGLETNPYVFLILFCMTFALIGTVQYMRSPKMTGLFISRLDFKGS